MKKISLVVFSLFLLCSCQRFGAIVTEPFRSETGIAKTWKKESGQIESLGAKYVIYETAQPVERTIVYLHGYLGDERIFETSLQDEVSLRQLSQELGPTRLVLVSFGLRWLLTNYGEKRKSPKGATLPLFLGEILPSLEKKHGFSGPYVLMGRSMGGANAATLCFQRPELWSKCVFVNPMFIPDATDPFRLLGNHYWKASLLASSQYESLDQWKKHRPSALLKGGQKVPPIYVTACRLDGLELFDGAEEWVKKAQQLSLNLKWDPVNEDCTHQVFPSDRIAQFVRQ